MLQTLAEQISDLEGRFALIAAALSECFLKSSIGNLLISEIFAEIADGDRSKLDEILTRSTAMAESIISTSEYEAGVQLQADFDTIVEHSESAFKRRQMLRDR